MKLRNQEFVRITRVTLGGRYGENLLNLKKGMKKSCVFDLINFPDSIDSINWERNLKKRESKPHFVLITTRCITSMCKILSFSHNEKT